ncbi:MAG: hypothetical protein M8353_00965 [ANME-2 cluster archaeon]|nr:hypothetical protein [ANME-2 cluster archaeon]
MNDPPRTIMHGRNQLILGLLAASIIFSLPLVPFVLESGGETEAFPMKLGNVSLVQENQGISLIDSGDIQIPEDHILDVKEGIYVDMYGRTASILLIKYPTHQTANDHLESLIANSGAKPASIQPLTAPAVFFVAGVNSARYFYVKKSVLYTVELRGVEFDTLKLAIMNI